MEKKPPRLDPIPIPEEEETAPKTPLRDPENLELPTANPELSTSEEVSPEVRSEIVRLKRDHHYRSFHKFSYNRS